MRSIFLLHNEAGFVLCLLAAGLGPIFRSMNMIRNDVSSYELESHTTYYLRRLTDSTVTPAISHEGLLGTTTTCDVMSLLRTPITCTLDGSPNLIGGLLKHSESGLQDSIPTETRTYLATETSLTIPTLVGSGIQIMFKQVPTELSMALRPSADGTLPDSGISTPSASSVTRLLSLSSNVPLRTVATASERYSSKLADFNQTSTSPFASARPRSFFRNVVVGFITVLMDFLVLFLEIFITAIWTYYGDLLREMSLQLCACVGSKLLITECTKRASGIASNQDTEGAISHKSGHCEDTSDMSLLFPALHIGSLENTQEIKITAIDTLSVLDTQGGTLSTPLDQSSDEDFASAESDREEITEPQEQNSSNPNEPEGVSEDEVADPNEPSIYVPPHKRTSVFTKEQLYKQSQEMRDRSHIPSLGHKAQPSWRRIQHSFFKAFLEGLQTNTASPIKWPSGIIESGADGNDWRRRDSKPVPSTKWKAAPLTNSPDTSDNENPTSGPKHSGRTMRRRSSLLGGVKRHEEYQGRHKTVKFGTDTNSDKVSVAPKRILLLRDDLRSKSLVGLEEVVTGMSTESGTNTNDEK